MYPKPFERKDRGDQYFFKYTDQLGNRRQKNTGETNHRKAQKIIRDFIDRITTNSGSTYRNYANQFLSAETSPRAIRLAAENRPIGELHQKRIAYFLTKHVFTDPIADKPLCDITPGDVIDFRTRLFTRLEKTPNTASKALQVFKIVLSEARLRGDLQTNPSQGFGGINYKKQKREVLSVEQIKEIFNQEWENPLAFQVFRFAAFTGMRCSEVLALHWSQLDGHILTIDRAWKTRTTLGNTKTNTTRIIPLAASCLDHLPPRGNSKDLIFSHPDGSRLQETWWRKNWLKACTIVTPHSLRHSLNSNLLGAGVSPYFVQEYLGWAKTSLTPTQEIYTHLPGAALQPVADMIEALYT